MGEASAWVQPTEPFIRIDPATLPSRSWSAVSIPAGWVWTFLVAWLSSSQLLLWRFLDVAPFWAYVLGGLVIAGLCIFTVRTIRDHGARISLATLLTCFLVVLGLLVLSGEGRFFYANVDWQVRFGAMQDGLLVEGRVRADKSIKEGTP